MESNEMLSIKSFLQERIDKDCFIKNISFGGGCEVLVTLLLPENFQISKIWKWGDENSWSVGGWHYRADNSVEITFVCNDDKCDWCCGD